MARQRIVSIAKENLGDFSNELLETLNKEYRVVCVSDTPIEGKSIKTTTKKPSAFATLRKNSILFDGDVKKCEDAIAHIEGIKIALDFDGVINSYKSGWTGVDNIVDEPVEGIMEFISGCLITFEEVAIFSSRCKSESGINAMRNYLAKYGVEVDAYLDSIDDTYILVDDRVIDYTEVDDIVEFLAKFDSWTKG